MAIFHFIYDLLRDMFTSGGAGIFLGCFVSLVLLALIALILWGLFVAVDSWFLPHREADGIITGKHYTPASMMPVTTTVSNGSGGFNTTTVMSYVPESWSVSVRLTDDRTGSMAIGKSYYDSVRTGRKVTVEFVNGRISRRIYIKALS